MDNERPDLVVTSVAAPAQAANGLPMTVTAVVRNQAGAPAATSRLGVFLSPSSSVPGAGTLLGLLTTPAIMPLTSATVTGAVMVPTNVSQGTYFLSVVADAPGALVEASDANNGLTAAATVDLVRFLPDLLVTTVPAPGGTLSGKLVSAPLQVRNAGPVASGPFRRGRLPVAEPVRGKRRPAAGGARHAVAGAGRRRRRAAVDQPAGQSSHRAPTT